MDDARHHGHDIKAPRLSDQLKIKPGSQRFLNRETKRDLFPAKIAEGAQDFDIISVEFYGNASAGDFTSQEVEIDAKSVPLSMVWLIGVEDPNSSPSTLPGGGVVPGSAFDSGPALQGAEVYSGAVANYYCDKDKLVVKVTSTDVGAGGELIVAFFAYALYYDEVPRARELGL